MLQGIDKLYLMNIGHDTKHMSEGYENCECEIAPKGG
jgi:hypothetical protein